MNKIFLKNKRLRLPIVLINIIWEYDGRYRQIFKHCVRELTQYFNHSRMMDRLLGEIHVYGVYLEVRNINSYNRFDNKRVVVFSKYILSRIAHYGDRVITDQLSPHRLKKVHHV